jgi:hypothetical protein
VATNSSLKKNKLNNKKEDFGSISFLKQAKIFDLLGHVRKLGDPHDPGVGLAVVLLNHLQVLLQIGLV